MINPRLHALCAAAGAFLLAVAVSNAASPEPAASPATPAIGTEVGERTIEDGGTGAYKAIQVGDTSLPTHTIFRPKDLSAFGDRLKLPILAWGNGACANSPSGHQNYLSEVASHGFLVIAIGPVRTGGARGAGRGGMGGSSRSSQLLDAINWAIEQNKNPASPYYGKLDTSKIGVFGHSCGGLQALEVSTDPRITTTIVVDSGILNSAGGMPGRGARGIGPRGAAPATSPARAGAPAGGGMMGMPALNKDQLAKLHAPVFYLLGGPSDMAYGNGMDDFKRIEKLPAFVANKNVGHGGTFTQPHGGDWAMVSVAWFKWQLRDDKEAGKLFTGDPCELSRKPDWTVDKKSIP